MIFQNISSDLKESDFFFDFEYNRVVISPIITIVVSVDTAVTYISGDCLHVLSLSEQSELL